MAVGGWLRGFVLGVAVLAAPLGCQAQRAESVPTIVDVTVAQLPAEARDERRRVLTADSYRQMGGIFGREREAGRLCGEVERAYALATAPEQQPQRVLYLIWRDPWMTVAPQTYISRTLAAFGWHTQPTEASERYPEVDLSAFAGKVEHVLLSSEPYHFHERHIEEVAALVGGAEVSLIDGEMTSWYGSRAIAGLEYLAEYTRGE